MTQPVINPAGQTIYEHISPLVEQDESYDWATLYLVSAIGAMVQDLDQIIEDTDEQPAWTILLSPDTCPVLWLPWLAWLYGVTLTPGMDEAAQRGTIRDLPPHRRGTPAALVAAVKQTLMGAKNVTIVERAGGDAYSLLVATRTAETPDPAATESAAWSQTPIDTILTYSLADTPLWDEATLTWDAIAPGVTWDTVAFGDV